MPQLVFRTAALRDMAEIASYIERESGSRQTADVYIGKLIAYCERLSRYSTMIGRTRAEIRADYRSTIYGNYVIFLRYADEAGPKSHLYIGNIVHGSRDLDAYFIDNPDDDHT